VDSGDDVLTTDEQAPPTAGLVLPISARQEVADNDRFFGFAGKAFDRRSPFLIGLMGAFGVGIAYVIGRGVVEVSGVLLIIGVALFIAIGLNPLIEFATKRGLSRGVAAALVTLGFALLLALFIVVAVPPTSHEVTTLVSNYPHYKKELIAGKGWAGKLVLKLHLQSYLKGTSKLKLPSGVLATAGKDLLSIGVGTVSLIALTIYFLIALPGVKRLWLSLIPGSRRQRVELLTNEVFDRVGGYMLGNLLTSLVAAAGTYVWLVAFGVPYPLLLALFVGLFDLIPMVGSTIAGAVVTLVALTKGLPVAIATLAFYVVYRFLEDYLLNPRVMKHTVRITPGITIIATLIGGTLLGLVGALIAIPVAATINLLLQEVAIPRQNKR
jgi:predicted PurR-regulated permease PerM